ncbi:MAG TPA: hypothetical protein DEB06_06805 [Phycisphaerales bacterium]|nr:hypothetical protein [Phycisphaerales bacterium]
MLRHAPERNLVYPTELYFYFRFRAGHRWISGNLRFTDAPASILHIGYFDENDRSFVRASSFDATDGVELSRSGPGRYAVSWGGIAREFVLVSPARSEPDLLVTGEEFVADIVDDSGHSFVLVWAAEPSTFRYVLNPHALSPETLDPIPGSTPPLFVGRESRFVFLFDESGRAILLGVHASNIRANNYYDGPFDQVPPGFPLKDKLQAAYPALAHRSEIDPHGNYLGSPGQRVAISPYVPYDSIDALVTKAAAGHARGATALQVWEGLTLAWRRANLWGEELAPDTALGDLLSK